MNHLSMKNPTSQFLIVQLCSIFSAKDREEKKKEENSDLIDRDVTQSNFEKSGNFFLSEIFCYFFLLFAIFFTFLHFSSLIENQTKVVKAQIKNLTRNKKVVQRIPINVITGSCRLI